MEYIEKIKLLGLNRRNQAIKSTKECIRQCNEIIKVSPNKRYWKKERQFYKDRLNNLKRIAND